MQRRLVNIQCYLPTFLVLFIIVLGQNKLPGPPMFSRQMNHEVVAKPAGGFVILRCPSVGYPTPNITWVKDGLPIKRQMATQLRKWGLTLENLALADKGKYTCIVSNEYGSINATFVLDVVEGIHYIPIFQDGFPQNVTVYVGETARLECRALSDLQPHYQWLKHYEINGSSVDEKGVPLVTQNTGADTSVHDPQSLVFPNITLEQAGQYTCVVGNAVGLSSQSAWITVLTHDNSSAVEVQTQFIEKLIFLMDYVLLLFTGMILF